MEKKNIREYVIDVVVVGVGCILLAFAIASILKQNDLMTGGVTGISIIISKLIGFNYTYIYYSLSLVVLCLAFLLLGKEEGLKIIILSIVFPLILIYFDKMQISFVENDLFLASLYYGLIAGAGVGLILRRGYSMGGTDTIAKFLHRRFLAFMSLSQILLFIDVIIIIGSLALFDKRIALYAIFTQFILLKTVDVVMFGFGTKKVKMEIISESSEEIGQFIMHEVHRGITKYAIMGGYSNSKRTKIVTVCSPRETMIIKNYIASNDKDAFVDILPVASVWGNGVGFDRIDVER